MKEMRSCWLQNIQLVNSLLNSFLVDMQHQSKLNKQQLPPIQSDRNPNLQRSISFIRFFSFLPPPLLPPSSSLLLPPIPSFLLLKRDIIIVLF